MFYESPFGCAVGRARDRWLDVWFFGMQLTLQERPDEVLPADQQGTRHFGVVLSDAEAYEAVIDRLRGANVTWLSLSMQHRDPELSRKTGAKIADPSGNVIELKYYDDRSLFFGES